MGIWKGGGSEEGEKKRKREIEREKMWRTEKGSVRKTDRTRKSVYEERKRKREKIGNGWEMRMKLVVVRKESMGSGGMKSELNDRNKYKQENPKTCRLNPLNGENAFLPVSFIIA